ncbi:glycoside hydrolase family 6 protein [Microlunatus soli]|nr:glycoside hydrolase family 6 protein [Microlunatus soli]
MIICLLGPSTTASGPGVESCPALPSPVYAERSSADATTLALDGSTATSSGAERPWQLGALFSASAAPGRGLIGAHLLIDPTGGRLYSSDARQIGDAVRRGYRDAGVRFWVPESTACGVGVRRFVRAEDSRYATTSTAAQSLAAAGWRDQGIAFRAEPLSEFRWPATDGKGPLDLPPYLSTDSAGWSAFRDATDPAERRLLYQIAATPIAIWLGGAADITSHVAQITAAAAARRQAPHFVLYAIPRRDCDGYAAGGLADPDTYRRWIDGIRAGIGGRPAVVVVEPDAIGMSCLSPAEATERLALLRYALRTLSADPDTWVYLHAGSAGLDPAVIVPTLISAGIEHARGFAVNVAGFDTTSNEVDYGKRLLRGLAAAGIADKHFVVDTSRNGSGRPAAGSTGDVPRWCNPRGRSLGERPTPHTGDDQVDALLWIKPPGESDGPCYEGDPTGWFGSYAIGLASRALARGTIAELPLP